MKIIYHPFWEIGCYVVKHNLVYCIFGNSNMDGGLFVCNAVKLTPNESATVDCQDFNLIMVVEVYGKIGLKRKQP